MGLSTLFRSSTKKRTTTLPSKKQTHKVDIHKFARLRTYQRILVIDLNKRLKAQTLGPLLPKVAQVPAAKEKEITRVVQYLSHNLSQYINKRYFDYDAVRGVSNAYLKLWEIYALFGPKLFKGIASKNTIIFHMCEAPGNWVKATMHYMAQYWPKAKYVWFANSLNPHNARVKAQYGRVFQDELGYMKKYPNSWLFGKSQTGDITAVENIREFGVRMQGCFLITGDAGLSKETPVGALQKLELAQFLVTVACQAQNCIIKNFAVSYELSTGHAKSLKANMKYSSGLISMYRKYYKKVWVVKPLTSSPISSEYYIIGSEFIGCKPAEFDKLVKHYEKFKTDEDVAKWVGQTQNTNNTNAVVYLANYNLQYLEMMEILKECTPEIADTQVGVCKDFMSGTNLKYERTLFDMWIKKNEYKAHTRN